MYCEIEADLTERVFGLEGTCRDLVDGGDWSRHARVLAAHKARRISMLAARDGHSTISSVARAIEALLGKRLEEVEDAPERLRDLIETLGEMAAGVAWEPSDE